MRYTILHIAALWSSDCGLFWVKDNTTGYCYRFSDNTLSWFQAQAQCKGLGSGSQLASINTAHEQSFIGGRFSEITLDFGVLLRFRSAQSDHSSLST